MVLHGAGAVANRTLMTADPATVKRPALVNGAAGIVILAGGQPVAVMSFTVIDGKISQIDALADPDRLRQLDLTALGN